MNDKETKDLLLLLNNRHNKIKELEAALKYRVRLLSERTAFLQEQRAKIASEKRQLEEERKWIKTSNEKLQKELTALRDERDWLVANGVKTTDAHNKLRTDYLKLSILWNSFQSQRRGDRDLSSKELMRAEIKGQLALEFAKKILEANGLDLDAMKLPDREY